MDRKNSYIGTASQVLNAGWWQCCSLLQVIWQQQALSRVLFILMGLPRLRFSCYKGNKNGPKVNIHSSIMVFKQFSTTHTKPSKSISCNAIPFISTQYEQKVIHIPTHPMEGCWKFCWIFLQKV